MTIDERKIITAVPENSETPLARLHGWVTPTRLMFVRNHFPVPAIDLASWRLQIEGCVDRPATWSWDELALLEERSVLATIECAGNGRTQLAEPVPGVQWGSGAVGHAEWTGVPLHLVLARAGLQPNAVEVVFEGADRGTEPDHPEPMAFERALPLDVALRPDTLLATRLNGELLTPSHGFPLRLLVPGWYGVASVKWLHRIRVLAKPFEGYYQTEHYTVRRETAAGIERVTIGPMVVKSEIVEPAGGAVLSPGRHRVFGLAWAGLDAVARVEVTTDGGASWRDAELVGPHAPYSWTRWECTWIADHAGEYQLAARATSSAGRPQPVAHDPLSGAYLIHHVRPITVTVSAG